MTSVEIVERDGMRAAVARFTDDRDKKEAIELCWKRFLQEFGDTDFEMTVLPKNRCDHGYVGMKVVSGDQLPTYIAKSPARRDPFARALWLERITATRSSP